MRVAWIIPCLNEETTIRKVVHDCREALPQARIFVIDNASTDRTAHEARLAGAEIILSSEPGKGNALRHAFREIDADYYIMIDGDGTYPADESARLLGHAITQRHDMVMGARLKLGSPHAFRPMHYTGNQLFSFLTRFLFRFPVRDLLTGLRVFSRHFVESVELTSKGFEIETELTLLSLLLKLPFSEIEIPYTERPPNSRSKLKTFRDGARILKTMLRLRFSSPKLLAKAALKKAA